MGRIVADSFAQRHSHEFTALASVLISVVAAFIVDRVLVRHERVANRHVDGGLSPVYSTRLRILRRVTSTTIIVIGVAIALTQFAAVNRAAAALLASSAIAAAVLGFAARQTLANGIAGILIAIAQPLRIGDLVTIEGETGVVEDVHLTYTFLRTSDDVRVVVPNERLASSILRNATIVSATVGVQASLWLQRGTDVDAALAALAQELPDSAPRVAEMTADGVRVVLSDSSVSVGDRELRRSALLTDALRIVGRTTVARDEAQS